MDGILFGFLRLLIGTFSTFIIGILDIMIKIILQLQESIVLSKP